MASLVIVESEEKAKTLREQSGGIHDTLVLRSVPMRISHDSKDKNLHTGQSGYRYTPTEKENEFARVLFDNVHKDIYLALDSDQRGEYWSWMLGKFVFDATKGTRPARRVHVTGFAPEELTEAFQLVEPIRDDVAASVYIRSLFNLRLMRHLKRLLGTVNGPGGLPLHYASLTTLFLLEERETEIASFAAPTKWQIQMRLAGSAGEFTMRLLEAYGITDDGLLKDSKQVKEVLALFEGQPCTVKRITTEDVTVDPPMPYRMAELLHDGSTLLGMGPQMVLRILLKFYIGVRVAGKTYGLVSPPFFFDGEVCEATLKRIRKEVEKRFGSEELVSRQVKGPVILPLKPDMCGDDLAGVLDEKERQLYELILGRALASQMVEAKGRNFQVECVAGQCLFGESSPQVTVQGFLKVFPHGFDALVRECPLADCREGQELTVRQVVPEQTRSRASEFLTLESVFDELADFSVPLETASVVMLQQMIDKGYLYVDADGCFHCGINANKVISTMNRVFPAMKGINLSAYFEQTVNEVISGRKPLDFALKQFEQNFVMHGVPQIKVHIPKTVKLRPKKSKSIIKSPEPSKATPPAKPASVLPEIGAEKPAAPMEEEKVVAAEEERAGAPEEQPAVVSEARPGEVPEQQEEVAAEIAAESEAAAEPEVQEGDGQEEAGEAETAEAEVPEVEEPAPGGEVDGGAPEEFLEAQEAQVALQEVLADETAEPEREEAAAVFEEPEVQEEQTDALQAETDAQQMDAEGEKTDKICPACGKMLLLQSDRFGRFLACSGYPACRHSESYEEGKQELSQPCPLCHKQDIVVKRTATGKKLYVCPEQDCEFMAWAKPHAQSCPNCASPFLVEKKKAGGQLVLRCPRAGCSYMIPLSGEQPEEAGAATAVPAKKKVLVRRKKGGGSGKKKRVVIRRKK